ncbi:MAG TPA: hypothetical protein VHL08_00675 [Dongiaceae bacterium]|nr:hypothetical protein [Dongiaceae bacterium]
MTFAAHFAELLVYYRHDDQPDGDWRSFFTDDPLVVSAAILAEDWPRRETITAKAKAIARPFTHQLGLMRELFTLAAEPARRVDRWMKALGRSRSRDDLELHEAFLSSIDGRMGTALRRLQGCALGAELPSALGQPILLDLSDLLPRWRLQEAAPDSSLWPGGNDSDELAPSLGAAVEAHGIFLEELEALRPQAQALLEKALTSGNNPPHLALFFTFAKLFGKAQDSLNRFSSRYADFYYRKILREASRGPKPDWTYLSFALDENVASQSVKIPAGTTFVAGQDADDNTILFATDRHFKVSPVHLDELRMVRVRYDESPKAGNEPIPTQVIETIVAPSAVGGSWPLFGYEEALAERAAKPGQTARLANLGFVLATPLLFLTGGRRRIDVKITVALDGWEKTLATMAEELGLAEPDQPAKAADIPDSLLKAFLEKIFALEVSTENGWHAVDGYKVVLEPNSFSIFLLLIELSTDFPALVPLPEGEGPAPGIPVLKATLRQEACELINPETGQAKSVYPLTLLHHWQGARLELVVKVEGLSDLILENSDGPLPADGDFLLFGASPRIDSFFSISHRELLHKRLQNLAVGLVWGNLPETGFGGYYQNHQAPLKDITDESFKVGLSLDGGPGPWRLRQKISLPMFSRKDGIIDPVRRYQEFTLERTAELPPSFNFARLALKFTLKAPAAAFDQGLFAASLAAWTKEKKGEAPKPLWLPQAAHISLDYAASASITFIHQPRVRRPVKPSKKPEVPVEVLDAANSLEARIGTLEEQVGLLRDGMRGPRGEGVPLERRLRVLEQQVDRLEGTEKSKEKTFEKRLEKLEERVNQLRRISTFEERVYRLYRLTSSKIELNHNAPLKDRMREIDVRLTELERLQITPVYSSETLDRMDVRLHALELIADFERRAGLLTNGQPGPIRKDTDHGRTAILIKQARSWMDLSHLPLLPDHERLLKLSLHISNLERARRLENRIARLDGPIKWQNNKFGTRLMELDLRISMLEKESSFPSGSPPNAQWDAFEKINSHDPKASEQETLAADEFGKYLSNFETRMNALEAYKAAPLDKLEAAVAALEWRVGYFVLEKTESEEKADPATRMDELEKRVGKLESGTEGLPTIGPLDYRINTLEGRLRQVEQQVDALAEEMTCFSLLPFGGWRRWQDDASPPLLALPEVKAELEVSFSDLALPQELTLLFHVAEKHSLEKKPPAVTWHYCDENGLPLDGAVVHDATHGLSESGIVTLRLPASVQAEPASPPSGRYWLAVQPRGPAEAYPNLLGIYPNAVTARWVAGSSDGAHLNNPLPAGSIIAPLEPVEGLGIVRQPLPSFDGRPADSERGFQTWLGERLRHKERAVQPWDYERLVLERFPIIWQARTLSAGKPSNTQPGKVLIYVVPGPGGGPSLDPLQPKAPADLLNTIQESLSGAASPFATITVANPRYVAVTVRASLLFSREIDPEEALTRLEGELIRYLSPWSLDPTRPPDWHPSEAAIASFIRKRPYVAGLPSIDFSYDPKIDGLDCYYLTSAARHRLREAVPEEANHG